MKKQLESIRRIGLLGNAEKAACAEIDRLYPLGADKTTGPSCEKSAVDNASAQVKAAVAAAEKAAPFVHPRISPVSDTAAGGIKDLSKLTNKELDDLEHISRKIAGAYGDPGGETKA